MGTFFVRKNPGQHSSNQGSSDWTRVAGFEDLCFGSRTSASGPVSNDYRGRGFSACLRGTGRGGASGVKCQPGLGHSTRIFQRVLFEL